MHWRRGQKVKGLGHAVTKTVKVARLLVTMSRIPHTYMYIRRCSTCGRCRRVSACRCDCLCFLVISIISIIVIIFIITVKVIITRLLLLLLLYVIYRTCDYSLRLFCFSCMRYWRLWTCARSRPISDFSSGDFRDVSRRVCHLDIYRFAFCLDNRFVNSCSEQFGSSYHRRKFRSIGVCLSNILVPVYQSEIATIITFVLFYYARRVSDKSNVTVWRLSVCPSVCLSRIFSNLNRALDAYSTWLTRGSMRRGQRTFPSEY